MKNFLTKSFGFCVIFLTIFACSFLSDTPETGEFPLAPDAPQLSNQPMQLGQVIEVIDGDTIRVNIDGDVYSVRYIGINTPERGDTCFQNATNVNADYVENRQVRLVFDESDTDRFGRLLRYVYVDEILVNAELVAGGWAESRAYNPDTRLFDYLEELEDTAVSENRGCQATGIFE